MKVLSSHSLRSPPVFVHTKLQGFLFACFLVEALTFPPTSGKSFIMGADEAMESELGLGELAGLTVANEADSLAYDVSESTRFIFRGVVMETVRWQKHL